MTRLARKAALLVALYLLTMAATASAECAWVLWSTEATITSVTREGGRLAVLSTRSSDVPMQSFVSLAACEKTRDWRSGKETFPEPKVGIKYFEYTCLPDTIDLRGSKEGTRWVLWTHTTEPGLRGWWSGATWKPHAAYSSKSECEDPLGIRSKQGNDPLGIRSPQDANLKCLPDTVDPRGPKAK